MSVTEGVCHQTVALLLDFFGSPLFEKVKSVDLIRYSLEVENQQREQEQARIQHNSNQYFL